MEDWDRDDWDTEDFWAWEEFEGYQGLLYEASHLLAQLVFLSDNDYTPSAGEDYSLGYLDAEDWWPLVDQLDGIVDLEAVLEVVEQLHDIIDLPGLPTELFEAPLAFLYAALQGNLPPEPSGRKVGSRKLVKFAQAMVLLLQEFPDAAQAAVRGWASVHRSQLSGFAFDDDDLSEFFFDADLPPALTGFSMMIGLTLMCWPERAEGLPLPSGFLDPEMWDEILEQWEDLPDSPTVTEEGSGEAEALFAQGQLAHMLAQMGTVELMAADGADEIGDQDLALAYSRLSRAVLWIHNQCRHCSEREGVGCRVATNWPERPVPLLDVAGEIANTGRIEGCVRM
jgi:hypothetical protein